MIAEHPCCYDDNTIAVPALFLTLWVFPAHPEVRFWSLEGHLDSINSMDYTSTEESSGTQELHRHLDSVA